MLVKKKKHNKIILISNVGTDFGGRDFVDAARKIIGKNIKKNILNFLYEIDSY